MNQGRAVTPFWLPLEARPIFLVKHGAMSPESVMEMVRHTPGSVALFAKDIDGVRVMPTADEPLDRIAGQIGDEQ